MANDYVLHEAELDELKALNAALNSEIERLKREIKDKDMLLLLASQNEPKDTHEDD